MTYYTVLDWFYKIKINCKYRGKDNSCLKKQIGECCFSLCPLNNRQQEEALKPCQ